MLAHFDQAVTGGAEGIEDDNEVQVDRGADLAPNAACPITSKGVRHRPTLPHRMLQCSFATCGAGVASCLQDVLLGARPCLDKHECATLTAVVCSFWSEARYHALCNAGADLGDRGTSAGSEGLRVREGRHC